MRKTRSLKALADAVLRRDTGREEQQDTVSHGTEIEREAVRQRTKAAHRRLYADLTAKDDAEDCAAWRWLLEDGPRSLVEQLYRHDERCDALIRAGAPEDEVREAVAAFVDRLREMRVLYRESRAQ